jgi:hypothetical protein
MSSSFSTLSASVLELLSEILDIQDQLHTVSMEYTVLRAKGQPVGLEVTFQCLLTEQKQNPTHVRLKKDVENLGEGRILLE